MITLTAIVGALCLAGAAGSLVWAGIVFVSCRRAAAWPSVRGEVVVKEVTRTGGTDTPYEAQLGYRYRVADRLYVGSRKHMGPPVTWRGPAEAEWSMEGYRKGGVILIHYDPRDPRESVVDPRDLSGLMMPFLYAALLIGFGVWLIVAP